MEELIKVNPDTMEVSARDLYEALGYKKRFSAWWETNSLGFIEGMDFDLTYFPLKHLGYKCAIAVTGELYAEMSHPRTMDIRLGISSKLDFKHIKEVWDGIAAAAKEHGYKKVSLDLLPSPNGLTVSISCIGETSLLMARRRPAAKSMDLICVSDNLGAAYMGLQLLEREKSVFNQQLKSAQESGNKQLEEELMRYKSQG